MIHTFGLRVQSLLLVSHEYIKRYSGDYSTKVPPLPIPNREVKLRHADGTADCGRVGSRRFIQNPRSGQHPGDFFVYILLIGWYASASLWIGFPFVFLFLSLSCVACAACKTSVPCGVLLLLHGFLPASLSVFFISLSVFSLNLFSKYLSDAFFPIKMTVR